MLVFIDFSRVIFLVGEVSLESGTPGRERARMLIELQYDKRSLRLESQLTGCRHEFVMSSLVGIVFGSDLVGGPDLMHDARVYLLHDPSSPSFFLQ